MPFNNKFMMEEYVSDLGVTYNNIPVKIRSGAPFLSNFYKERAKRETCSLSSNFQPRRLKVLFNNNMSATYPVPKMSELENMLKTLMPSILAEAVPGESKTEAICIDLEGEKWESVPRSISTPKLNKFLKIPLDKKLDTETIKYVYSSDIFGTIKQKTTFPKPGLLDEAFGDLDKIVECQKSGLKSPDESNNKPNICASKDFSPRKFLMGIAYINDENEDGETYSNRQVIISSQANKGFINDILDGFQPTDVGKKIEDCSRCVGYKGEMVKNIHLYVSKKVV